MLSKNLAKGLETDPKFMRPHAESRKFNFTHVSCDYLICICIIYIYISDHTSNTVAKKADSIHIHACFC